MVLPEEQPVIIIFFNLKAKEVTVTRRGFAGMDQVRQKQIASKGGKVAHERGTAHEFTAEEARLAGRKGGEITSRDRLHMAEIGRQGAVSRRRLRAGQPDAGWVEFAEKR